MGAIRVNLTNGTSKYINLDNSNTASIESTSKEETVLNVDGTPYSIRRFRTPGQECWPIAMEVAYTAISASPVEFGYPILASNLDPKEYIKYDAAKIGDSVIASALNSDAGNIDSVWSERTAISLAVSSEEQGQELADQMAVMYKDAESEGEAILVNCLENTNNGEPFESSACGEILPLNGGQNDAGCIACRDSFLSTRYSAVVAMAGEIVWKHESIFLDVTQAN
jgi:hypothetical protein